MTRTSALWLGALAVVITGVAEALAIAWTAAASAPLALVITYAVYSLGTAAAGARIVAAYPGHRVGWLLIAIGSFNALGSDASLAYGVRAHQVGWPGGVYGEVISYSTWFIAALALMWLLLLFPDGQLLSPRWRWTTLSWAVGAALLVPGWVLSAQMSPAMVGGTNPLARDLPLQSAAFAVGLALVCAPLAVSVGAPFLRWRRAVGVARNQLTWFVTAAVIMVTLLPLGAALWNVTPIAPVLAATGLCVLPAAAYVAILRHHLYDVDLVVSRTVTYVALTSLLALAYVAVVLAIGTLAPTPVAAAAAALVTAVLALRLRDRAQDVVDRHFRRARYETHRLLTDFVDRVRRGEARPEEVERALRTALDDPELSVRFGVEGRILDADGNPSSMPGEPRAVTEAAAGLPVAVTISHRPEDAQLLATAVDAARLALDLAALQVGLRSQLAEVAASRARLVTVADQERRRLSRDLHDGAQQRLVTIGLGLRHAQHLARSASADTGPGAGPSMEVGAGLPPGVAAGVDEALDSAVADLADAIDDLRMLASGLHPATLDAGLGSALQEVAARAPLPVRVRAARERFSSEAEATAYFIACEGLTNALKHSGAQQVEITAERDEDDLVITVADDGRGGAHLGAGNGLISLRDRARARGGTLLVDSPGGRGTRLVARFPCG